LNNSTEGAGPPIEPCDVAGFLARGISRYESQDFEAAIGDFDDVIRLEPDHLQARLYRALALIGAGQAEAAITDCSHAIQLAPHYSSPFYYRGRILNGEEEYKRAIEDLTTAIRIDDESAANSYFERGLAWYYLDDLGKALADLTEAIRRKAELTEAHEWRGHVLESLGKVVQADQDFDIAEQLESNEDDRMAADRQLILPLMQKHFEPVQLDQLTITERTFPARVRADIQRAIDQLVESVEIHHFCGVRKQYDHQGMNFTDLIVRDRNDPPCAVPPQYEEFDIGETQPIRCLKSGLWLIEDQGVRMAVFQEPFRRGDSARFQVATVNNENGIRCTQRFFQLLETAIQEARSYRGKIISLERVESYMGVTTGIKVHKLRPVAREQVILPQRTLDLLERNVIQFVLQRPRLAKLGLATKKGLLFYGPPGTGKTHTLHYLAAALSDTTTLIISAEQVGILSEYMTLARLLQPSMVVIEDADLIARDRENMSSVCEEALLNKLLNEMDGLKQEADILFVLTTNRPQAIEAALSSRPGRIDQAIEFPHPDDEGRGKLVRLYVGANQVSDDVVDEIVKKTENVSAAFIKELMRRAAQFQLERDADEVSIADVNHALDELLFAGGSLNRKLLGGADAT